MTVSATITKFCHGIWRLESQVQLFECHECGPYVVTEATPFHPVSHIWPDHPADKGSLIVDGISCPVTDCQVGAVELVTGKLHVGTKIPVKREEPGWIFVVVHDVSQRSIVCGQKVTLVVDKAYQKALSRGHSAGHLAFLALNKVLTEGGYWRKDADRKDPHGYYDFNSYAQVTSFVTEDHCFDTYRLGKTLRKRGLNSADMLRDLPQIADRVNTQLKDWLQLESVVKMDCRGEALTDSRYWCCDLKQGIVAVIPCGGTHVTGLTEFQTIRVVLQQKDEQSIEMHTNVNV